MMNIFHGHIRLRIIAFHVDWNENLQNSRKKSIVLEKKTELQFKIVPIEERGNMCDLAEKY